MLRITIYNEFVHEREEEKIKAVYPEGIHMQLASFLKQDKDCTIKTFTVDDVNEGLTDDVLDNTDVLLWWGHMAHERVDDATAWRVHNHVLRGMGAIFLHSAHMSKPFRFLMGSGGTLTWKSGYEKEVVWKIDALHPIAQGIPEHFILEQEEMYSEPFDIPTPDSLVFIGWYSDGHVFRSGCAYKRGAGRVFYFQPGHEEFPIYFNPVVQKVIDNAVDWVTPVIRKDSVECPELKEPII